MTTGPETDPITGGCQCGAVRYALHATLEGIHLCHCRMCQKAVGGPFAALARVRLRDLSWTRGTPATFASSSVATRSFCARCGTPLTYRYLAGEWINVTIGSLDRPADAVPVAHYGIESRLPWLDALDRLPVETTGADEPERLARTVSHQHPDAETGPGWQPPTTA